MYSPSGFTPLCRVFAEIPEDILKLLLWEADKYCTQLEGDWFTAYSLASPLDIF